MEMHSRQSLYEIHGISDKQRRRRARLVGRLLIKRIFAFLAKAKRAIAAELAARRALNELAEMDDHMLRDLGLVRGDIANAVRRPREHARADDPPTVFDEAAGRHPVLPTVRSPDLVSEAKPEQERRRPHPSFWD
jgi:uncharacterized protein YjiS (DUF1127 family)